jgi:hypothetical protein
LNAACGFALADYLSVIPMVVSEREAASGVVVLRNLCGPVPAKYNESPVASNRQSSTPVEALWFNTAPFATLIHLVW